MNERMKVCSFVTDFHSIKVMIFDQFKRYFTILFNHRYKKSAFIFKKTGNFILYQHKNNF